MLIQVEDAAVVPLTIKRVASKHEQRVDVTFFDHTGETSDATYRLKSEDESVATYVLVAE